MSHLSDCLVTAMDPLRVISVSNTKSVFIEEPNYPVLVYCDIVARPLVTYACSVVMFGNVGPVEVAYSNANISVVDIPGQIE